MKQISMNMYIYTHIYIYIYIYICIYIVVIICKLLIYSILQFIFTKYISKIIPLEKI